MKDMAYTLAGTAAAELASVSAALQGKVAGEASPRTPEQARAEKAALEAARQEALARVEALLTIPGLSAGVQRELEDCKQDIRGASSLAHLGHILKQVEFVAARAGIDSATLINMTREQRIEGHKRNMSLLTETIRDAFKELGMTKEQEDEHISLEEAVTNAKTEEERKAALAALKQWEKEFLESKRREAEAIQDPEARKAALQKVDSASTTVVEPATKKRDAEAEALEAEEAAERAAAAQRQKNREDQNATVAMPSVPITASPIQAPSRG